MTPPTRSLKTTGGPFDDVISFLSTLPAMHTVEPASAAARMLDRIRSH